MLVDGKTIATEISAAVENEIKTKKLSPRLVVFTCNPNFETRKYLSLKQKKAATLGVDLKVEELPLTATTENICEAIKKGINSSDGIIVQLPLPNHINVDLVLSAVPVSHDVDAFSYNGEAGRVLPPVVGAIDEIAKRYNLIFKDKKAVVFGEGRLVGAPSIIYLRNSGALVDIITINTKEDDVRLMVSQADVIVLGVGKPNLLLPDMVKNGAIVFDAGASEDGGLLVGDANPLVAEKTTIFTPVPGGIGPITISLLYRNLLQLLSRQ